MAKITYENKVALNENANVDPINKVRDVDMNEIKQVVNQNDDNMGDLSSLETAIKTSIVNAINEVLSSIPTLSNTQGTSQTDGYSQEYINELNTYSTDEVRIGTWIDGKPLYRKVLQSSYSTTGTGSFTVYLTINESVDTLTGFDSYFKGQGKNYIVKVGMSNITNITYNSTIWYSINNKTFSVTIGGKGNNDVIIVYVIAYYTKTTD